MKKMFAFLLAVVMVLSLAACGSTDTKETVPSTTAAPVETTAPAEAETTAPTEVETTSGAAVSDEPAVVNLADYLEKDVWEDDGGDVHVSADGIEFDNAYMGDFAALRLNEEHQNVTYKFNITMSDIPEGLNMEPDWTWWDAEFTVELRSSVAGSTSTDGQTGYCLSSWGDMAEVFVGRTGHDDAFGSFQWNVNDGNPHDVEFSAHNNEDGSVTLVVVVDGTEIFRAVDDGTAMKNEEATPMYLEAGGLTIRCKYLHVLIK